MGGFVSGESLWRRVRRTVTGAAPAAGADWSITVPAGHAYRLLAVTATLTTSATVADRTPRFRLSDGDAVFLDIPAVAVQAASLAGVFSWARNLGSYALGSAQAVGIPDLILQPGWIASVLTDNLDSGDAWSAPIALVDDMTVRGGPVDLGAAPELYVEVVAGPQG